MLKSPYLPWVLLLAAGSLVVAGWAGGHIGAPMPVSGGDAPPGGHDDSRPHYVTPGQLAEAGSVAREVGDGLEAVGHDGRRRNWGDLSGGKPVVLVFIKSGCPCSVRFEPFFHRLEAAYHGEARLFGVIDADIQAASRYVEDQQVPYPVLADPELDIVRRLGVKSGCYLVLLTPTGAVEAVWPGCSADGMRDAGRRIARLAGVAERPLDVSGMPSALTAGCPFE